MRGLIPWLGLFALAGCGSESRDTPEEAFLEFRAAMASHDHVAAVSIIDPEQRLEFARIIQEEAKHWSDEERQRFAQESGIAERDLGNPDIDAVLAHLLRKQAPDIVTRLDAAQIIDVETKGARCTLRLRIGEEEREWPLVRRGDTWYVTLEFFYLDGEK